MNALKHASLGLIAAALLFSAPAFAASLPGSGVEKPSVTDTLKDKAADAVEQAKDKADAAADKLEGALGHKQDAAKPATEGVDVNPQSVTGTATKGMEQGTVPSITPETPKIPSIPGK